MVILRHRLPDVFPQSIEDRFLRRDILKSWILSKGFLLFQKHRPPPWTQQVAQAGCGDKIRRERCGRSALRSVPAINNFPRLAALEELDQIALLTLQQTEVETGVVVVGHIQERRERPLWKKPRFDRAQRPEQRCNQGAADRPRRPRSAWKESIISRLACARCSRRRCRAAAYGIPRIRPCR